MADTAPLPIGVTAIKPVERHGLEAVKWFLWDKDKGAIMGRTPLSWALITVFYIIYYSLLAGFWALMLFIFFQTIDDKEPTWVAEKSIIGTSPALGIRPGQTDKLIDSSIIMYNKDAAKDTDEIAGWEGWVKRYRTFLEAYSKENTNAVDCKSGGADSLKEGQFCKFDPKVLGPCGKGNFGYDLGKPCVLVKLNKIYSLVHDYYNSTTEKLPEDFPDRVKGLIDGRKNEADRNQVWVDCNGENPADVEGMGTVSYNPPTSGMPAVYFPYLNQKGYLPPLVAVQFDDVQVGQLLHVECRAWAKNIGYHKRDKIGRAHFELLVHSATTAAALKEEL